MSEECGCPGELALECYEKQHRGLCIGTAGDQCWCRIREATSEMECLCACHKRRAERRQEDG